MADPSLQPILERLNGTASYHPFTADTFTDWASEAGDKVTVSRNNDTYVSPVHKQTISWHGKQQVAMETGGNKEREAVERLSERKYRSGGGGALRSASGKTHIFEVNDEHFLSLFEKTGVNELGENETLTGVIEQTAESLTSDYTRVIGEADTTLRGLITQTAESLTSDYTQKISSEDTTLRGLITQTAESLTSDYTQAIGGTDTTLRGLITQTAASLTSDYTALNNTTNETMRSQFAQTAEAITAKVSKGDVATQLAIDAGNVTITGGNLLVIDGYITTTGISTAIAGVEGEMDVNATLYANGGLYVSGGPLYVDNVDATFADVFAASVSTDELYLGTNEVDMMNALVYCNVTANTLTLRNVAGDEWTFSKATTLTGAWDSGVLTVLASPQNQYYYVHLDADDAQWGTGDNVNRAYVDIYDGDPGGSGVYTGFTVEVNANGIYGNGRTQGRNDVVLNKAWNTSTKTATISKSVGTGSPVTISLDAADAEWNGNTATVKIYDGDPGNPGSTYTGFDVTVLAGGRYNAGWGDAYDKLIIPKPDSEPSSPGSVLSVSYPKSTPGTETADSTTYNLSVNSSAAYIKYGGFTVAKVTHSYGTTTLTDQWVGSNTVDNATFTVTSSPQTGTKSTTVVVKQSKSACWIALDGAAGGKADGAIIARISNPQYAAGWKAAYDDFDSPMTKPADADMTNNMKVKYPNANTDGSQQSRTYYVTVDNEKAYIKYSSPGSTGVIVAQTTNSAYYNGISAVSLGDLYWNTLSSSTLSTSRTIYGKTTGRQNTAGTDTNVSKQKTLYVFSASSWELPSGKTADTATSTSLSIYIGDGSAGVSKAVAQNYVTVQKSSLTFSSFDKWTGSTTPSTDSTLNTIDITTREFRYFTARLSACGMNKSYKMAIDSRDVPSSGGGSSTLGTVSRQSTAAGDTFIQGARKASTNWSATSGMYYKFSVGSTTYYFIG